MGAALDAQPWATWGIAAAATAGAMAAIRRGSKGFGMM